MKHLARLALGTLCAFVPGLSVARTWYVSPSGPETTIQGTIAKSIAGDLIVVLPGTYHEGLVLRDGVSVAAQTVGTVFVNPEGDGSAITAIGIGASTTVSGIVFQNGSAESGGGLYAVATNATFVDCTWTTCAAVLGGGAHVRDGSHAIFNRCTFIANEATIGGGIYLDFSAVTIDNSTFANNLGRDGSAIAANNASEARFTSVTCTANIATQGSTISCNDASPRFLTCTISANSNPLGTFALRGSGTRVERCIVAFNAGPLTSCAGTNSPWFGCNILYGNTTETMCGGDVGSNLFLDPLFCALETYNFTLAANSPAIGGSCGTIGAYPVGCAARNVGGTAVEAVTWSRAKSLFGR